MSRKRGKGEAAFLGIIVFVVIWIFCLIFLFALSTGCSLLRPAVKTEIRVKDSTVIHYRDSLRIRNTLVYVALPAESSQNLLPAFAPSHLETSLAESDAWVDTLGLHHTLRNRKGSLVAHVPKEEHIIVKEEDHAYEKEESKPETVYVEKELSAWQRFRIGAFWWLLLVAAVGWRRELLWLIRKAAGLL